MWVSQMRRRFAIAASDRVDCPATYNRIVHDSSVRAPFVFFTAGDFLERDSAEFFGEAIFFFTDQSLPFIISALAFEASEPLTLRLFAIAV